MIRLEAVSLQYERAMGGAGPVRGPEILRDLSFTVAPGGFRWLLGPSGAGKSSLLRLLHLAARPTRGRLGVLDAEIVAGGRRMPRPALAALRRRIGMVFQDFRLLPHLDAFDNVALPLRLANRPEGEVRADVTELLRWIGLARHLRTKPAELSGGERQCVAIARAVIARPALLLADEPTGHLDDAQTERLMRLFKELRRIGTTIVVATHDQSLVERYPAAALHIANGRLSATHAPTGA